ncbi:hypothetical protein SAMN02982931_02694 [Bauldia litoralis]|uniref:Uncharacterized protein n=1 Tax=Bauldia litoralis TaxID=665467 RepID=A0A1G6CSG1_9HYPH|nr:hypothetical protein SAMN02982931_02694 [Bauldia litoralis]
MPLRTHTNNRAAPFPLPSRERALPLVEPKASREANRAPVNEGDPNP